MNTATAAEKILDVVSDMRYSTMDMDSIGFHLVNLSPMGMREQLEVLADSVKYHNEKLPRSEKDGQYALF
jgi:hypothetical protein